MGTGYYHSLEHRGEEIAVCEREGRRPPLRRVCLHLTSQCTLSCSRCRARRTRENLTRQTRTVEWHGRTIEERELIPGVLDMVEELAGLGAKHMHLTGGEATLVKDLPELVGRAAGRQVSTSLVTNAASPNGDSPAYVEALVRAGIGTITVSLDPNTPEEHDRLVRMPGAHAATVAFIRRLAALAGQTPGLQPAVYVNVVVTDRTVPALPEHIRFLGDLGVTDVKLLLIKQNPARRIRAETYASVVAESDALVALAQGYGFELLSDDIRNLFPDDETIMANVLEGVYYRCSADPRCYLARTEIAIASDGEMYPCIYHFWDESPPVGFNPMLRPGELASFWASYKPEQHIDVTICRQDCTRKVIEANETIGEKLSPGAGRRH